MNIAIVICFYGKTEMTLECIKSVRLATSFCDYKIFLVDDRGPGETLSESELDSDIRFIRNKKNIGYLRSCNKAFDFIDDAFDYIYLLNNDCLLRPDSLSFLAHTFSFKINAGAVGSKLIYPDGRLQEAGGIYWSNATGFNVGRNNDNPADSRFNYVREVDKCSAASLLVRRDLLKQIGGYDERFAPAYKEDADLCFSIREKGFSVIYQPLSEVIHVEGESCGTQTDSGIKKYQILNQPKFVDKWSLVLENHLNPSNKEEDIFNAKFKPLNSPVALFVDDAVPQHNKNAGALGTYLYLKLFTELGYRVVFIPDNHKALEPYTTELMQYGIEVKHSLTTAECRDWIKQYGKYIKVAWLSRPDESAKYIDTVKRYTDAIILYCGRDLHFKRNERKLNIEGYSEKLALNIERLKYLEAKMMNEADYSLLFTDADVQIARTELSIVPDRLKIIPAYYWDFETNRNLPLIPTHPKRYILFVGGFKHSPNLDGVNWFLSKIMPKIIQANPSIGVLIVGSHPPLELLLRSDKSVKILGFVEDLDDLYGLAFCTIAPLRFGSGIKGKIVDSLRRGVPVVSTGIGTEGMHLENLIHCIVTDNESEFADAVIKLFDDLNLQQSLAENGFNYAVERFSRSSAELAIRSILDAGIQ